jgi:tol-pal system protein YbgF
MRSTIRLLSTLAAFLALSACTSGGGLVGGSSSLERELNVLKMEVANLKDGYGSGQAGANLRMELDSMRLSIQRLNENVDTSTIGGLSLRQQLEYISARLDRLENRANLQPLDRSVVQPNQPVADSVPVLVPPGAAAVPPSVVPGAAPATQGAVPTPGAVQAPAAVQAPTAALPESGPPLPPGQVQTGPPVQPGPSGVAPPPVQAPPAVQSAYDRGKALFDQKDYGSAIRNFQEYLKAEPSGKQAPAAQYYIGESLYFQSKFEDAILEYQTMITGFPKNNLVSAALLKQGLSFQALGDVNSAKLLYNKVVRDYPKSYSAGVARERLKTL